MTPPVNCNTAMEHHRFKWVNHLKTYETCSIFNSYVSLSGIQRVPLEDGTWWTDLAVSSVLIPHLTSKHHPYVWVAYFQTHPCVDNHSTLQHSDVTNQCGYECRYFWYATFQKRRIDHHFSGRGNQSWYSCFNNLQHVSTIPGTCGWDD